MATTPDYYIRVFQTDARPNPSWKAKAKTLGSGIDTIKTVMNALEAAGVEVFDDYGLPGCRLKSMQLT